MNIKDKIMKTIKDFKRLPTSRIAGIVGADYTRTLNILKKFEEEGKVVSQEETIATYWSLK